MTINPSTPLDALLLDDDPLVRMTWEYSARKKGMNLRTFATAQELFEALKALPSLPKHTPIYVDSHLGESTRGETVCHTLSQAGFSELYITTGYPPSSFTKMPWIKGIFGKEPPWIIPTP